MKENWTAIINNRIETIGRLTSYPTSREAAISQNQGKFLHVDNNPTYGGRNLVLVGVDNGAHYNFSTRNKTRQKPAPFVEMLDAMIFGLEYGRN